MLAHLIQDEPGSGDDVAGFNLTSTWSPGIVRNLAPTKVQELGMFDPSLSSGHSVKSSGPVAGGGLGSGRREA